MADDAMEPAIAYDKIRLAKSGYIGLELDRINHSIQQLEGHHISTINSALVVAYDVRLGPVIYILV